MGGLLHRRLVRAYGDYLTVAWPVRGLRPRYRAVRTNRQSECPLEWRAGFVEGFFTPLAAPPCLCTVTPLSPGESESL